MGLIAIAKLLLSRLLDAVLKILAFTIEHWRVFFPLLILCLCLWRIHSLTEQRDDIQQQYEEHLQQDLDAQEKRRIDNTAKYLKNEAEQALTRLGHQTTITTLKAQYALLKKDNGILARDNNNFRQRVQLDTARIASLGLSGISGATGLPAESGGDCNATAIGEAYSTLDLACSITTADYNALWEAWDKACKIHGCK